MGCALISASVASASTIDRRTEPSFLLKTALRDPGECRRSCVEDQPRPGGGVSCGGLERHCAVSAVQQHEDASHQDEIGSESSFESLGRALNKRDGSIPGVTAI